MKRSSGSAAQPADSASDHPLSTIVSARLDDVIDSLFRVQRIVEDPLTEPSVIAHATFRMAEPVERLAATLESIETDAFLARDRPIRARPIRDRLIPSSAAQPASNIA